MDSVGVSEQNPLIREIMQGCELTRKLEGQLDESCPTEVWKSLVKSIIASLEKAMSVVISSKSTGLDTPYSARKDSPQPDNDSPRSNNSDHIHKDRERKEISKKRKAMPKWTRQVRVCSTVSSVLEGPPEDGCSWRKYGQKDIFGAKFPRGYYRCTHRHSKGCLATKHVQRSEKDPSVFDVTYRGEHSCSTNKSQDLGSACNDGSNWQQTPLLLEQVKTEKEEEDLKTDDVSSSFPFFSPFCSHFRNENYTTPISSPPSTTPDGQFIGSYNYFAQFVSSAVSEFSSYHSPISCPDGADLHSTGSGITDMMISGPTFTTTPVLGSDFELDQLELNPEIPFDVDYFS